MPLASARTPRAVRGLEALPRLGVGLGYQAQLRPFFEAHLDRLGFVEVVPDILWTDMGVGAAPRYVELEPGVRFLRQLARERTVIPHSIGLSIGSAHRFEREHVEQMARWHEWLRFPWHSDHLSFHLARVGEAEVNLNLTLPLTHDRETLERVSERVRAVRARIDAPFLLENNVYFWRWSEDELGEPEFLNALCKASGCGLLLDLHNLYTNARNLGFEPRAWLERLDLERVIEIHVAGGFEQDGVYLDAHSGAAPREVMRLLDWTLPLCANVRGVVFELFGTWYEALGERRLLAQVERLNESWAKHARGAPISA